MVISLQCDDDDSQWKWPYLIKCSFNKDKKFQIKPMANQIVPQWLERWINKIKMVCIGWHSCAISILSNIHTDKSVYFICVYTGYTHFPMKMSSVIRSIHRFIKQKGQLRMDGYKVSVRFEYICFVFWGVLFDQISNTPEFRFHGCSFFHCSFLCSWLRCCLSSIFVRLCVRLFFNLLRAFLGCRAHRLNNVDVASVQHVKYPWKMTEQKTPYITAISSICQIFQATLSRINSFVISSGWFVIWNI